MNNPKELEEILLNLSVEEWCFIKNNPRLRKKIENALGKDAIDNIEEKRREAAKAKAEEKRLKAQKLEELSVTVHNDDDYLPV